MYSASSSLSKPRLSELTKLVFFNCGCLKCVAWHEYNMRAELTICTQQNFLEDHWFLLLPYNFCQKINMLVILLLQQTNVGSQRFTRGRHLKLHALHTIKHLKCDFL